VDLASSYEFSNVIHVLFLEKQLEQLTIFQKNENKTVIGQLQLKQAGNYQVNIRNSHGQLVYNQEQQLQEGMNEFKSELPNAAEGIYYIELVGNEQRLNGKILIR